MNCDPMRRANLLMQQKRFAQAAEAFLEVLAEFPNEPEALASLGWCQTQCGQLDLGEENIQRAIEQAPGSDFLHQIHALHLSHRGRHAEAEAAIRQSLVMEMIADNPVE
ncbi:tetratricopeptide repeat protein [Blastopirellula retiformator]|uniref:Tetratricopeptide repeat protein n=1 Tax=Blastopirellula retiformator TaxID=2527970 RepID=A0A5C5V4V2_9BACT|nr:tetratricopeptide repeat protein [Blastopirellula retiformator]TWT32762.1 Tetratricopeptide repeat protein [Blastopirellula retiformator]